MQVLTIIRGVPGSGKSHVAKSMAQAPNTAYYEADMFFVDEKGQYNFDPSKLSEAHSWCRRQVMKDLSDGKNVIVSNTFLMYWEIEPYLLIAENIQEVKLQVIHVQGDFENIHGCPIEKVAAMRERFEYFILPTHSSE